MWCGRWKAGRDDGAATIEYVGLLFVIAAIVLALGAVALPAKVTNGATSAICSIFDGRKCDRTTATGDDHGGSSGTANDGGKTPGWTGAYYGNPAGQAWQAFDDQVNEFLGGVRDGGKQAVSGLLGGAWDDVKGFGSLFTHPMNAVRGIGHIVTHPWDTVQQLVWDDGSRQAWHDHKYVKAVSRGVWNVGSWFIPGYDLGKFGSKITKLGKIADEAGKLAKVAKAAERAEKAAQEAERAAKSGDVERANRAATEARKEAEEARREARKNGCRLVGLGPPALDHFRSYGRFGGPLLLPAEGDGCKDATDADAAARRAENAAKDAAIEKKIRDAGYIEPLPRGVRRYGKGIIDEREKPFNPEETRIAERLAGEGKIVKGRAEGKDRTPDAEVDGVPTEFKTLRGKKIPGTPDREVPTPKTVKNALSSARGQSGHAVLDGRGSGISKEAAQEGINDYLRRDPRGMTSVRIIGDGWELNWP